uniref:Chemokine interleukin-8-like domain-containing protein n=1 Tax=Kryptolebias marmoratus TaxID=37003 RepID=A0A3Q3BD69_KRYMA
MSLSQRNSAFLMVFMSAVCIELLQSTYVIGRCECPEVQRVSKINVTDFKVIEKSATCAKTELILTQIKLDNSTQQICVDTLTRIAKNFLRCWERIQKDESRKTECIEKKRKADENSQRTEGHEKR